ncbi:MAG: hypothetical protein JXA46_00640 [Dehalococcoidales bacterium]|nr:hypothetical protein [Dehalococcoidales bacterium]
MEENITSGLEKALADSETEAGNCLKAAQSVNLALKKYIRVLKEGNVKEIQSTMNEVEKTELNLREQIAAVKEGWQFDVDSYLNSGDFVREVLSIAEQKGARIFERDDRLYSYPVLVRVLPAERSVLIDKAREKKIRPTVLVDRLKDLQKKPPRFRPEAFLEALYEAYQKALRIKGKREKNAADSGEVVELVGIYDLFTLMPGQSREYSRQEFGRDIYLLDKSGVCNARNGSRLSLPASTGTKISSRIFSVISEYGEEKRYYGIAFTSGER